MGADGQYQDLSLCTVQIRRIVGEDPRHWDTVGTGFVVSCEGTIVTCAHVVEAAAVNPRVVNGDPVGVYFPLAAESQKARKATVCRCLTEYNDDVAVLQLAGGEVPVRETDLARLANPDLDPRNKRHFLSFGFRRLDKYLGLWAEGTIMFKVPPPESGRYLSRPIQLECKHINHGMSGAPVLEVERNRVVGVISETWYPDVSGKDPYTGFAVSADVLGRAPLNLPLEDNPYPLAPTPRPPRDVVASAPASSSPRGLGGNPPPPVAEWAGRNDVLQRLNDIRVGSDKGVVGIIGFGGEGKSSLARQFLSGAMNAAASSPLSAFWWTFTGASGVDDFLERCLVHLSGGTVDPLDVPSALMRVGWILALLTREEHVLVLDGLEEIQHDDADHYGRLKSSAVLQLLQSFGLPSMESFCLVTSRSPLVELQIHRMYQQIELDRLSPVDGRALLRKVGAKGSDADLDEIVTAWDGHALTLSLLGAYAARHYNGDVTQITGLPALEAGEPRSQQVDLLLQWYDARLSEPGRSILMVFSVFRKPVERDALDFVAGRLPASLASPQSPLGSSPLDEVIKELESYQLLRQDERSAAYFVHPLVRAFYYELLSASGAAVAAHHLAKEWYLTKAAEGSQARTLEELSPLIEAVHHACHAQQYSEAYEVYRRRIDQNTGVLQYQLGAYDTDLELVSQFFEGNDVAGTTYLDNPPATVYLLRTAGLGLMTVGRLADAATPFQLSYELAASAGDWDAAARSRQVLSELRIHLGELAASVQAARQAVQLYQRAPDLRRAGLSLDAEMWGVQNTELRGQELSICAHAYEAWAEHLAGNLGRAAELFDRAESLLVQADSAVDGLRDLWGIYHADHLRHMGKADRARTITKSNLSYAQRNRIVEIRSQCHRVLGELDATAGQSGSALVHLERALKLARTISHRAVLLEALIALGRWQAKWGHHEAARERLQEAIAYASAGSYRIYEVDGRVALAWAWLSAHNDSAAKVEAGRAADVSAQVRYRWGSVDADEILSSLSD